MRTRTIPVGRAAMMVVALLVLAHLLAGATVAHSVAEADLSLAGFTVPGSAPPATSPVACRDGGSCMNADRPALNVVLLLALALALPTATLVLVEKPRVPMADRLRPGDHGPAPPTTHLIAHVVLLI